MRDPNDGFDARADKLAGSMDALLSSLNKDLNVATRLLNKTENSSRLMVVGISVAMFAFVTAAFVILFYKVVPPVEKFVTSMRDINSGSGDLTRRLSHDSKDEVGAIVEEFNTFTAQLQAIT